MLALAMLIVVLNYADGLLTLFEVGMGYAEEINPLMAHLLEWDPMWFLIIKHLLVSAGVYILLINVDKKVPRIALWVLSAGFLLLMVYHAVMLAQVS